MERNDTHAGERPVDINASKATAGNGTNTTSANAAVGGEKVARLRAELSNLQQQNIEAAAEESDLRKHLREARDSANAAKQNRSSLTRQMHLAQKQADLFKQQLKNETNLAQKEGTLVAQQKKLLLREQRQVEAFHRSSLVNISKLRSALERARATATGAWRNETKADADIHQLEEQQAALTQRADNLQAALHREEAALHDAFANATRTQANLVAASSREKELRQQLAQARNLSEKATSHAQKAEKQAAEQTRQQAVLRHSLAEARADLKAEDARAQAATRHATIVAARAADENRTLQQQLKKVWTAAALQKKNATEQQHKAEKRAAQAEAQRRRVEELILQVKNRSVHELEQSQEAADTAYRKEQRAEQLLLHTQQRLNETKHMEAVEQKREDKLVQQRQAALHHAAVADYNATKAQATMHSALSKERRSKQQTQELQEELNRTLERLHNMEERQEEAQREEAVAEKKLVELQKTRNVTVQQKLKAAQAQVNQANAHGSAAEKKAAVAQATLAKLLRQLDGNRQLIQNLTREKDVLQQQLNETQNALTKAQDNLEEEAAELQRQHAAETLVKSRAADDEQRLQAMISTADRAERAERAEREKANAMEHEARALQAALRNASRAKESAMAGERALTRAAERQTREALRRAAGARRQEEAEHARMQESVANATQVGLSAAYLPQHSANASKSSAPQIGTSWSAAQWA